MQDFGGTLRSHWQYACRIPVACSNKILIIGTKKCPCAHTNILCFVGQGTSLRVSGHRKVQQLLRAELTHSKQGALSAGLRSCPPSSFSIFPRAVSLHTPCWVTMRIAIHARCSYREPPLIGLKLYAQRPEWLLGPGAAGRRFDREGPFAYLL